MRALSIIHFCILLASSEVNGVGGPILPIIGSFSSCNLFINVPLGILYSSQALLALKTLALALSTASLRLSSVH